MTSIYKIKKDSLYYVGIKYELKNGKEQWFVKHSSRQGEQNLIFKDFEKVISHIYFYWGLSKMKDRNYDEIYELVKEKFHLCSGEDILKLK